MKISLSAIVILLLFTPMNSCQSKLTDFICLEAVISNRQMGLSVGASMLLLNIEIESFNVIKHSALIVLDSIINLHTALNDPDIAR